MSTYAAYLVSLMPTFLAGRWGRAWARVFGAACDAALDGAKDAARAGFVLLAPVDALERHLADASLEALPGESTDSKRARVAAVFDFWDLAGTEPGMRLAADQLGFVGYTLRTTPEWAPGLPPDRRADLWSTWWVMVPSTGHPWTRTTWGSGTWGSGTWGSSASRADVARVKRLLRAQSPARGRGRVRLYFGGGGFWGGGVWGGGVWGPSGSWIEWTVE